jgi:hypothetical protein
MTNKERQKQLDEDKWFASQMYGEDKSGKMGYCHYCSEQTCTHKCYVPQRERVKYSLCAKAYNRLNRSLTK